MTGEPFDWNESGELADRHKALLAAKEALSPQLLSKAEDYWKRAAPGETFDLRRAVKLLLRIAEAAETDLGRYQSAAARIFEKERDQKILLDHKTATGQDSEADRQRWLAYLEMTHILRAELSAASPASPSENSSSSQ